MDEVYSVLMDGLTATYADAGLPNEIDHSTRLLSVVALLNLFPRSERREPEQVREILERALPASIRAQLGPRLTSENVYSTARSAWQELKERRAPLSRVYAKGPPFLHA